MTRSFCIRPGIGALFLAAAFLATIPGTAEAQTCARTITADVVALDQVFFWNRLGAVQPQGMMYALRSDVISSSSSTTALTAGNVQLRPGKRPRPLVLRINVGDCLKIKFQNLLFPTKPTDHIYEEQSATRNASIHVVGLQLVDSNVSDGSYVGQNTSSGIVAPGSSIEYLLYGEREGEHVMFSTGAMAGGEGNGGQLNAGLFGAVIVEPANSVWYRSQVTQADMAAATTGVTANTGHPIINFNATYGSGKPILKILDAGNNIVYSDVTAIIAGTGANGRLPAGTYKANVTNPDREQPFREFVTIYHDEVGAVQAFPEFENTVLSHTLHSGRDAFAINYGAAGVGAEVLANRLKVGPMHNCTECKFEEFFLTSWVVGDPAMVVDTPANAPCLNATANPNNARHESGFSSKVGALSDEWSTTPPCTPTQGPKATKAFFPEDPSNVYHSYLGDHTKFRVLHAGSKEHHVHHLHAHQWLYAPDDDESSYLDSQALGPGSSFTAEIAKGGSGNLNFTPGDSIFHCHFYPHFAQGMWALWRVHDVFERGTVMDADGKVALNTRAYPDGEIPRGTPIPGVLPLPGKPMAPLPGATVTISPTTKQAVVSGSGNPGYPFFIPAQAGHRPPKPPLDTIDDGGLPRHIITAGTFVEAHTRLDFHKELLTATAVQLAETGTAVEQAAMTFHATRNHLTCLPDGTCGVNFTTNGRPAIAGAPIADPCVNEAGTPVGSPRLYKIADIQDDVKLNKRGWHFPQQRFISLWEDVDDFLGLNGISPKKAPEPLFFRANSNDCITVHFANLVPKEYVLDDFQVRTPTDILGQHIHLVKFDVLASDGAANGWNYEDGSFSPGEVVERIKAIRAQNGCTSSDPRNGTFACPTARPHPKFGTGPMGEFTGAQTTVQRWYADPIKNNNGKDRTLRTIFTHDHYGPSTHQQAGLYAGLVIEPTGSTWFHNETGVQLGTNTGPTGDGGPTSWQAVIVPPSDEDYREFLLAFADFQPAYPRETTTYPSPATAINPPAKIEIGLPDLLARAPQCPGGVPLPCPELISAADTGTMSVNYRNEPLALRVRNPSTNTQATGNAGDLSMAFATMTRADTMFNLQPIWYTTLNADVKPKDPYTPLMRAYDNDRIQIRILVSGHEEGHNFNVHGIKWLQEPSNNNSGYRNSQMMGISEHFEFIVPKLVKNTAGDFVDRLWSAGSATDDLWNGIWGLFRAYEKSRGDLMPLPDNPRSQTGLPQEVIDQFTHSCPNSALVRNFDVTAITAQQALPGGRLVYNSRTDGSFGPLFDPTAILYVRSSDLDANLQLKSGVPVEPLILRARAGECVRVVLKNRLPDSLLDLNGYNTLPMIVDGFNTNDILPSNKVGLHPQMLYYDVSRDDGANIGNNMIQTAAPGGQVTYSWYAGDVEIKPNGTVVVTPIEFGATNLMSSDRIEHASKGAIGALIIEPADATWTEGGTGCLTPVNGRCTATFADVSAGGSSFREFVTLFQNDVNFRTDNELPIKCEGNTSGMVSGHGAPVENLHCIEDAEDSGHKAINYRSEPFWKRMGHAPGTSLEDTRELTTWSNVVHNSKVGGVDPQTPVFIVTKGQQVRFRVLEPGGHARNTVFALHGHIWDKQPYVNNSTQIGRNNTSLWEGARMGHGPSNHFDAFPRNGAGGKFSIVGDYLFRDQAALGFDGGLWGILRVVQ